MKTLIVGLGNPGKKYEKTRHNIGFRIIDELINNNQDTSNKKQTKFNSEITKIKLNDNESILVKPQTFMNQSGIAVKKIIGNWKLEIGNCVVIHDDIDLLFGDIRVSKDSSSAGHKGVQSIIDTLGTKDFSRIRIGIKQITENKKRETEKFVLESFSKTEEKKLPEIIKKAVEEVSKIIL